MHYLRIFILLVTLLLSPLFAITPETLITFAKLQTGTTSESPCAPDALRLYTYYQGKLLNDLTNKAATISEAPLWGLLEKGHNPENVEQSSLEWHASILTAQNWGNLDNFEWIKATSQSDMILGFLNSAYTSVCLAGINIVPNINETLAQIQKQSSQFLLLTSPLALGEHVCFETINPQKTKLAIQLGRNIYYQYLYRDNTVINYPTIFQNDGIFHEIPLDSDLDSDTTELLGSNTAEATEQPSENEITNNDSISHSLARKSIQIIQKILLNHYQPDVDHPELLLSEIDMNHIYLTMIASMAILDADGQKHDWISEIKSYISNHPVWSNIESSASFDTLLLAAKRNVEKYRYKTPSYFSYGYKKLPDPLNPSMETQNGTLLLDSIPLPEVVGRAVPVDLGFMYEKLKEMGDYGLQYLKPMDDSIICSMIDQIYNDIGITTHYQKATQITVSQQIQEGLTYTQQVEQRDVITYTLNNGREITAPYPIQLTLTNDYCQWKDIVYFLDEVLRAIAAPNLIHQRTNFAHSFDLSNLDFNFANNSFVRENGTQLTQEEANAIMRGTWYKEVLNFTASYHYARSNDMLLNFYEEVLPSSKASNPCLPGKIRQVTNWYEIQLTKKHDQVLSAIRMLFPASHTYEGIQFNAFLDFIAPKLARDFITQKIEQYAMTHSIFLGGDFFGIDDFQKDDDGNYTLKKICYKSVLEHNDFEVEVTTETFEDYARNILFNTFVSYFIELNSMNTNGTYRYPTAHQLLIDGTGIQAFHSGHILFNEDNLPDLPNAILNGFEKVNGATYEYGLLGMYTHNLPHAIDAIKKNPYCQIE